MMRWITVAAAMLLSLGANAQQPGMGGPDMAAAMESLKSLQQAPIIELTDGDVERMIALSKEAETSDIEVDGLGEGDMPNYNSMAKALGSNTDAVALLSKHGFTPESYRDVAINVALAMGAAEMRKNEAQMEASLKQLEAAKGMMPEDQYNMLVEQITGTLATFEKAPDSNIELVEKFRPELENL